MQAEPFLDNWTYLKVELNWLERLLLLAVARQRKEVREVERVAQTKADRATSHWWKGVVSLDGSPAFDSPPEKLKGSEPPNKLSYDQQLEARIQASFQQGIGLALPQLRDRFNLSIFEKNLLLMGLAPEVHRRYGQLYGYLQSGKNFQALPSVDLALRLFCRTDAEWRAARAHLSGSSVLIQNGLLELLDPEEPLLHRSFRLPDEWVSYLLEERSSTAGSPPPLKPQKKKRPLGLLEQLVLPDSLRDMLLQLSQRVQFAEQVDETWGFQSAEPGVVALFTGAAGTGKTIATQAIAQLLQTSPVQVDLALLTPDEQRQCLKDLAVQKPTVVLVRSAEHWLSSASALSTIEIAQFLQRRRECRSLTFLSSRQMPAIRKGVRSHIQFTLKFPKPDKAMRLQLWQQAFPEQVPLDEVIEWEKLAEKPLTGGEIATIARSAAFFAAADSAQQQVTMQHILKALG